jgi:hypothetical protein
MASAVPPRERRPEVPEYVTLPADLLRARKRAPKVVFPSLSQHSECVWISHEDMLPGI